MIQIITCILDTQAFESDSGGSKGLWGLQMDWSPNGRDNAQTGHTEQPARHIICNLQFATQFRSIHV